MADTSKIKQYFKKCFDKKLLLQKGVIALCALVLVLIMSLSFYFWLKDKDGIVGKTNPFWYIDVLWNDGIGFSALVGNFAAIYAIQSVMFVLLLAIFIFVTNDKISASFVALAMFGGLFNLIQRACAGNNCVLDYFHFGFWDSFPIFNWPDMFVVIGIFGFVISYIVITVKEAIKEDKASKVKNEH